MVGLKEKSAKEVEVKVKKLQKGKTYKIEISGIRVKGSKKYTTLTRFFVA